MVTAYTSLMRVAVLSDVHGTAQALEAVLADAAGVDLIVANGDLLSFGPKPVETLEMLRSLPSVLFVSGNNDRYLVERRWQGRPSDGWEAEAFANLRWTAEALGREAIEFLAGWPFVQHLPTTPSVAVFHASPLSDNIGMFPWTPDQQLARMVGEVAERVVVCGHTHLLMERSVAGHRVISDGSAGIPFDHDPRPSYIILDDAGGDIDLTIRRVSYDIEAAARDLQALDVPFSEVIAFQMRHAALMPKHQTVYARRDLVRFAE
jgi:predicted phosphodiesterase